MSRLSTLLYKEVGSNSPKQGICYISDFRKDRNNDANICVQIGRMPTLSCTACPWNDQASLNLWLTSLFGNNFTPIKIKEEGYVSLG